MWNIKLKKSIPLEIFQSFWKLRQIMKGLPFDAQSDLWISIKCMENIMIKFLWRKALTYDDDDNDHEYYDDDDYYYHDDHHHHRHHYHCDKFSMMKALTITMMMTVNIIIIMIIIIIITFLQ